MLGTIRRELRNTRFGVIRVIATSHGPTVHGGIRASAMTTLDRAGHGIVKRGGGIGVEMYGITVP
jgi:hypothetical protein